jgi:hypothetical protein
MARNGLPRRVGEPGAELNAVQPVKVEAETGEQILATSEKIRPPQRESRAAIGLALASLLLPCAARLGWLEEQRGYLADLNIQRERLLWVLSQVIGMPRYAYTVRTAPGTSESASTLVNFVGADLFEEWRVELVFIRTRRRRAAFLAGLALSMARIDFDRRSRGQGRRTYLIGLMLCLPRFMLVLRAIRLVSRRSL